MSNTPLRIGLLFMGDEREEIWGSAVTTLYLGEALSQRGARVWRASATADRDWQPLLQEPTDLIIAEGVPAECLPEGLWNRGTVIVFWSLSTLYYSQESLADVRFHGVATNSDAVLERLTRAGVAAKRINLAASATFSRANSQGACCPGCVYLGCYPHKSPRQMKLLFEPASAFGLSLWGYGWENSPYSAYAKGPLPLRDIPLLYHSADLVLALTEESQKALGMINNRIYEALACGAVVLSDTHPTLEESDLGNSINFVGNKAEAERFLGEFYSDRRFADDCRDRARHGRALVLGRHTYQERAADFYSFYQELTGR